jgi:hypothetical protein
MSDNIKTDLHKISYPWRMLPLVWFDLLAAGLTFVIVLFIVLTMYLLVRADVGNYSSLIAVLSGILTMVLSVGVTLRLRVEKKKKVKRNIRVSEKNFFEKVEKDILSRIGERLR